MIDLKSYFHKTYQGGEDFIRNVILPIFGEDKYEDAYEEDVLENNPELTKMASAIGISQVLRMGTINIPMNPTDVFDITVSNHVQMERNRVAIQSLVRRIMSTYSSAFMVFHYDDDMRWDWRFTFCSKKGNNQETTDSKRYTFLLGPNQSCRTAAENFKKLADKCGDIELEDIVKAFDVESLSKEFFEKYKLRYGRFVGHVIGKEYIDRGDGKGEWHEKDGLQPSELFYGLKQDEKVARDYVKKLLGRIVFLHFLQKKGWLGATDKEWTNGPQDFMLRLYDNASADQQANFLDEILEPLFSCLDTPLKERRVVFDTKVDGLRSVRVPFLGGLFERSNEDKALSVFPADLFADLFKFLSEYNFTIDENDPNDAQVGVDPEMLGRIFENLLEDNKDKGAFYTPKEIVQYMCRESLIAYLQTDVTDEDTREALRQFVTTHDVEVLGGKESVLARNVSQCLKNVKICDPAIGSGAFPMGLLNELFLCRGVIEDFANAAAIKRHIIQQNIYGVDIEKGAVEIARLRFWLSLITDADKPDVLPNMDFKIMQGNSLLEQYKGFDLSHIMDTKMEINEGHQYQMFEERIDVIRAEVKDVIKKYYSEQSHDMRRTMREGIQQKIQRQIEVQGINVDITDIKDIAATQEFFLWHTWFSEVFDEGGFDIVIGNPPYVFARNSEEKGMTDKAKAYYYKNFHLARYQVNLYHLFVEQGTKLLAKKGVFSFIIPNNWMTINTNKEFRKYILTKSDIHVTNFYQRVFDSADVDSSIIIYRNYGAEPIISLYELVTKDNFKLVKTLPVSILLSEKDYVINIERYKNDSYGDILIHIESKALPLDKNFSSVKAGLQAYEVGKGTPVQTKEMKQCRVYHSKEKLSNDYFKYIDGVDVKRYCLTWENKEYLKYGKNLAAPRTNWDLYSSPRILVRQIPSKPPYCIQACYTDEVILNDRNSMNIINITCDPLFLLGVLNSRPISFWFEHKFGKLQRGLFPQFKINELSIFPIPFAAKELQSVISDIVDRILTLKKQNPQVDISALEHEIDLLVYDLYGLTEEEIKIVEGTNKA